jgi:hypothetical protein
MLKKLALFNVLSSHLSANVQQKKEQPQSAVPAGHFLDENVKLDAVAALSSVYNAVSFTEGQSTFQRNVSAPSSGWNNMPSKKPA